jgi:hypothetical protein
VKHQARPRGVAEPIASYGSDRGEVVLYRAPDGTVTMDVRLERETIWLNLNQMADLFDRDKSVISRHLRKVFDDGELERDSAIAFFATTAADGKTYQVEHFNLDAIISVGYRVNSKRGTQFRIWATRVLREHLLKGYTVNERRLKELKHAIRLISTVADRRELTGDEATGLLRVVADYSFALDLLDDYDNRRITVAETSQAEAFPVTYEEARDAIERLRREFNASDLFGREKDDSLRGSLEAVMQTAGGKEARRCIPVWRKRRLTSSTSWLRITASWMATSASPPRCSSGFCRRIAPSTAPTEPSA